jgi:uncharacterized protein
MTTKLLATNLLATKTLEKHKMALVCIVGSPVEGESFFGRVQELQCFLDHLERGNHVLISAERRIGKTSLIRKAQEKLKDKFICLRLDLQQAESSADVVAELGAAMRHTSIWEKVKEIFANPLKWVEKVESIQVSALKLVLRSGMTRGDWRTKGNKLFDVLAKAQKPVVIFMDEVPIFINRLLIGGDFQTTPERRQNAELFMSWLRANSLKHAGKIRLVITGSIGLEPVLQRGRLSYAIDYLTPFSLNPWEPDIAKQFILEVTKAENLIFQPDALDHIIEKLGSCVPYYVQLFVKNIRESCQKHEELEVTCMRVAEVYEKKMLGVGNTELQHIEDELKLILEPDLYSFALNLLTEAAVANFLTADAVKVLSQEANQTFDVARNILRTLEQGGHLQKHDQGYQFISKLINDSWKRHHSFGFIPTTQRGETR